MEIATVGIDLGKTVFHLVGLSPAGENGSSQKIFAGPAIAFHCQP